MKGETRPAWSEAFTEGELAPAPSLEGIEITRDWAYGDHCGSGVRVAIIDSGVDADHPLVGSIGGSVLIEADPDGEPPDWRAVPGPHADLYGHGTACAAIIRRLAPAAELFSVRVLGEQLTGKGWVFAAGIEWCLENDIRIVNMSLSTSNDRYFETFHDLVDRAAHAGIVLVSAMANEAKPTYPSEFAGVLSVAATDGSDPEVVLRNTRPPAEWGAPGIDVEVAWLGGSTVRVTGNSFAAPVITAHVARILATHPQLTVWQVKTVLAALAANAA